jgi:DNA transformation protein
MRNNSFKDFVLEQLQGLEDVRCVPMFGGFGLYLGERFFGIIGEGKLYFKTNEKTREQYIEYGSGPFIASEKQILKNYYEVPIDVLENPDILKEWILESTKI